MILDKVQLLEYITTRKYFCSYCQGLQKSVIAEGLDAINNYRGMICGGIEDMQIRLMEAETGIEFKPVDIWEEL